MDKIEGNALGGISVNALSLTLTRSTIKMQHSPTWRIDKRNSVHDLIICLTGTAEYEIEGEKVVLSPGRGMLIEAGVRFVGRTLLSDAYTGIAQHFTLDVFGRMDLVAQMDLRRSVAMPHWSMLEPLVRHYRETAPPSSTNLAQHHLFMVLLIEFIEAAFLGWCRPSQAAANNPDALSLSVMVAASQIAADPLNDGIVESVLASIGYNRDYFRREFRRQVGLTPHKYQEFKRMERAMGVLAAGGSVKKAAEYVGYADFYYFSRMFKRYIGISPAGYKAAEKRHRDGGFPRGEEDGLAVFPILSRKSVIGNH